LAARVARTRVLARRGPVRAPGHPGPLLRCGAVKSIAGGTGRSRFFGDRTVPNGIPRLTAAHPGAPGWRKPHPNRGGVVFSSAALGGTIRLQRFPGVVARWTLSACPGSQFIHVALRGPLTSDLHRLQTRCHAHPAACGPRAQPGCGDAACTITLNTRASPLPGPQLLPRNVYVDAELATPQPGSVVAPPRGAWPGAVTGTVRERFLYSSDAFGPAQACLPGAALFRSPALVRVPALGPGEEHLYPNRTAGRSWPGCYRRPDQREAGLPSSASSCIRQRDTTSRRGAPGPAGPFAGLAWREPSGPGGFTASTRHSLRAGEPLGAFYLPSRPASY